MATADRLEKYKKLLINLLPPGRLFSPLDQPVLDDYLESLAVEFCRVEERVLDLLRETDPRQADELIDDWERLLGLPDECTPSGLTLDERRTQVLQKYTNIGGLNKIFYEFIGEQLGATITVTDFKQFNAGTGAGQLPARGARAGDPLTNFYFEIFEAGDNAGDQLRVWGWRFYFQIDIPLATPTAIKDLIECTMQKLKPAHSAIFFTYS